MNDAQEQARSSSTDHLKPWQFKPGQSGNPGGRKPGPSLKEYAKKLLAGMNEEERMEYLRGLDKKDIWQMAEGKPDTKTDLMSDGKPLQIVVPQAVASRFDINGTDNETERSDTE